MNREALIAKIAEEIGENGMYEESQMLSESQIRGTITLRTNNEREANIMNALFDAGIPHSDVEKGKFTYRTK